MKKFFAFLVLAVCITNASATIWWQRGDSGSTWQQWSFDTSANPATPENYGNPYGTPSASIVVDGTVHADPPGWYDSYLGRNGVWHGDFASVTLTIPNAQIQNPYKEIWVEVGFRGELLPNPLYPDYPGEVYGPKVTAWIGGSEVPQSGISELGTVIESAGSGWRKLTIGWRVYPNPDSEEIYLAFHDSGADIDYVIVDTICVPEPATLSLLVLGGLAILRRKS